MFGFVELRCHCKGAHADHCAKRLLVMYLILFGKVEVRTSEVPDTFEIRLSTLLYTTSSCLTVTYYTYLVSPKMAFICIAHVALSFVVSLAEDFPDRDLQLAILHFESGDL